MYVVVKVVVEVVPPLELVWMRYLIAVIALGIIGIMMRQSWKIAKKDWLILFLVGLIGNTISIVTQEMGTMLSTAQMGGNYYGDNPPCFYGCLRPFDFKRKHYAEKVLVYRSCHDWRGGIIVGNGKIDVTQQLGGLYLLLAALTWALMSVLVKKVPSHYSQIVVTTYTSLIAVMLLTPFVLPRLKNLDLASVLQPTISGGACFT